MEFDSSKPAQVEVWSQSDNRVHDDDPRMLLAALGSNDWYAYSESSGRHPKDKIHSETSERL